MVDTEKVQISVYPTLILGVGGTGCKIAKRLKRTLQAEGAGAMNIKFAGIDTDLAECEAKGPNELPLDTFIGLGGQPVHFDPKDKTNAPLMYWLPTSESGKIKGGIGNLTEGQGAGGHRLVGRFGYNYFAPDQFMTLQRSIDELVALTNNPFEHHTGNVRYIYKPGLVVYIVGSLVGGTGSGSFLDAIATIHMLTEHAITDQNRYFFGTFLLPSVFEYRAIAGQNTTHKATAYASLKDLDLLMSTDDAEMHKWMFFGRSEPYQVSKQFLNNCYLVSRYSGSGALIEEADVYDLVATQLYASIGTPFGADSNAVENNSSKAGSEDERGGQCNYSAFGLVGMDYSQKLLIDYCATRLGAETVSKWLGSGIDEDTAQKEAERFMREARLSASEAVSFVQGDVGNAYIRQADGLEDEKPADLHRELSQGFEQFRAEIKPGGSQYAALQHNYRDHSDTRPGAARQTQLRPGQESLSEAQMWKHRLEKFVEETADKHGLRGGKRVVEILHRTLQQTLEELGGEVKSYKANAGSALTACENALSALHGLTPTIVIFRRNFARQVKEEAVRARNGMVQTHVTSGAAETALRVYSDGLLPMLNEYADQFSRLIEALETVYSKLHRREQALEQGSEDISGMDGALDRSRLLHDVLPASSLLAVYEGESPQHNQLIETLLGRRSALHLLDGILEDNKAEALRERIVARAETRFQNLKERHILDVLTQDATDQKGKEAALLEAVSMVAQKLRPHAPVPRRPGDARTYDYCIVMYPHHNDKKLSDTFANIATTKVREQTGANTQVIETRAANNRIIMVYMQHGIPLNAQSFMPLAEWLRAYESLRKRDPYLDVDKRWIAGSGAGAGTRAGGGAKSCLCSASHTA